MAMPIGGPVRDHWVQYAIIEGRERVRVQYAIIESRERVRVQYAIIESRERVREKEGRRASDGATSATPCYGAESQLDCPDAR